MAAREVWKRHPFLFHGLRFEILSDRWEKKRYSG